MSQSNELSVTSAAADTIEVNQSDYPWISHETATVPTTLVTLQDGTTFRFGSLIGLNGNVEKIAAEVSEQDSISTQRALFMGLPEVLSGRTASGISKVENYRLSYISLYIASRNLLSAASLFFTPIYPASEATLPTVLRVGISTAKQRPKLLNVLGIHQAGGKRRKT